MPDVSLGETLSRHPGQAFVLRLAFNMLSRKSSGPTTCRSPRGLAEKGVDILWVKSSRAFFPGFQPYLKIHTFLRELNKE
jgi:hypothetical protein